MQLYPEMIAMKQEKNPFLPLSSAVYQILFDHLLCYVVRPGEKLYESKIALQLEISRTPVASAFDKLELNGFILREKGHSARVAPFDPDDYYNIAYTRASLERAGTAQAYCRITPDRLQRLRKYNRDLILAWKRKDYYRLIQSESRFHRTIIQYSENRYTLDAYDMILPKLMLYWGMMAYPSMINNSYYPAEHDALLGAFEKKNIEVVKSTIKYHTKRPYLLTRDELMKRQEFIYDSIAEGAPIQNIYNITE